MLSTEPRAGITRDDIRTLIESFYDKVRRDPDLGYIFERHIGKTSAQWAHHLDKIEDFWANVMLRDRAYSGNPMMVHRGIPEADAQHFAIWLDLFEQTAREVLPAPKAEMFDRLARRIGQSLVMGIERVRNPGIPNLR